MFFLNPVRKVDEKEFKKVMTGLRILRQNMFFKMGRKTVTYRELYPHAIGYDEDLDQEIELKPLFQLSVDGSSARHDSLHKYSMTEVPVLNFTKKTIDLTKGEFAVFNVSRASSNDVLIVHPPRNIEGIQYKSSENITLGYEPDPNSKGVLTLEVIKDELRKVTNEDHKNFYSGLKNFKFNLFIITNKPLMNHESIINDLKNKNNTKPTLPRGVSIICHENFKNYAGCFAYRGIYLPLKNTRMTKTKQINSPNLKRLFSMFIKK